MKYKALKKVNKHFYHKYTKEASTQEMHLTFGNCKIYISEQTYGVAHTPQLDIVISECTYSISLKDLILKLYPNASVTDSSLL